MSSGDPVEDLRVELQGDRALRDRFRQDPEGVMGERGLPVDDGVRQKLQEHDVRNLSDDDLQMKLTAPGPARTMLSTGQ